jgi:D-aspartate ligase
MKLKNKAVVLGTNYYIGLSIARCLGRNGVHVVSADHSKKGAYGRHSKYLSEKIIVPNYKTHPEEFIDALIDFAKKQDKKPVLYPSADQYVEMMDRYMDRLRPYYLYPDNRKGLCLDLMNKESIHKMAEDLEVLVPETVKTNRDDYADEVRAKIGFPCLVKPTDSPSFVDKFRRKLFIVESEKEMKDAVDKAREAGLEVIVQRIIPGFDDHMYTFDAYMDKDSNITHWLTCQKFRQYPINYGASVYTSQKYEPALYDIGSRFFKGVGFKGFAEIEFKKDAVNGKFYLIEANIRTTNLNVMLDKAGINMPLCTYSEMIGEPLPPKAIEHETGYTFRYLFEDYFAIKGYISTGQLTKKEIKESLNRKIVPAIWDKDDPLPGASYTLLVAQKALGKVLGKLIGK